MVSQVKWSEEQFVDLLISKMTSRFDEISWGSNANTVREALKFEEEIFAFDFKSEEEKNEFFQFLLNEGFQPKKTRIDGIYKTEWFFSVSPKNSKIAEFLEKITRYYESVLEASRGGAKQAIENFINSGEEFFKYFVIDTVQRKVLNEEITKYNQETIVYNNRRNANYHRPFIIDVAHVKYPIVLLFKQQKNDDILAEAERFYLENFWKNMCKTLYSINSAMNYANLSGRRILVHVDAEYAHGFKLFLEGCGLKVDYFSTYTKASYVDVMRSCDYRQEDSIVLFVEIYQQLIYNEDFVQDKNPVMQMVLREYKRFCMLVNKNAFK